MDKIDKLILRHEEMIASCKIMLEENLEDPRITNFEITMHKLFIIELKQLKKDLQ